MEMEGLLFQLPTIYQVDGFSHDCFLDIVQKSFQTHTKKAQKII